jgi:hypothetical protein
MVNSWPIAGSDPALITKMTASKPGPICVIAFDLIDIVPPPAGRQLKTRGVSPKWLYAVYFATAVGVKKLEGANEKGRGLCLK